MEQKELIKLASAHATQLSSKGKKTGWSVEANITNEKLVELPQKLKEQEVFLILNFARKYELEALNIGIDFQKKKNNAYMQEKINLLTRTNEALIEENERLATVLDKMTKG